MMKSAREGQVLLGGSPGKECRGTTCTSAGVGISCPTKAPVFQVWSLAADAREKWWNL